MKFKELFDPSIQCPSDDLKIRYESLIGVDNKKEKLTKIIGLLINPDNLLNWTKSFHSNANGMITNLLRRPPLVVLEGDVGSGKTELATTIGDAVAREQKIEITVLPLSLTARGKGNVGEMTQLISNAFADAIELAEKYKRKSGKASSAVVLLVDEADALVQSRENAQMHHEDRAGVNAFIRGIDRLGNGDLPIAVIMCTNRVNALDPAIKRRAVEILKFGRPTKEQRAAVVAPSLKLLGFTEGQIESICAATGKRNGLQYGFTFSDLRQRLLPSIILDAYPNEAVNPERAIEIAKSLIPTHPFNEQGD